MRGNSKYFFSPSFLIVIFLISVSCSKKEAPTESTNNVNHPPNFSIKSITTNQGDTLQYLTRAYLTCNVENDSGGVLKFVWSAARGTFQNKVENKIEFVSNSVGRDTIKVSVSDARNTLIAKNPIVILDKTIMPFLVFPLNWSLNIDISPTLIWKRGVTENYQLQIATDNQFNNIIYGESGIQDTIKKINGLSASTTYYWHVRYITDLGRLGWSEIFHFTTISAPSLISPPNESINISTDPILNWSTGDPTNTYTLEISTNENFPNLVYNKIGLTNKIEQVTGLQRNTTYYWRVTGTNVYGSRLTSGVFSFKTIENENVDSSACKGVTQILYEGRTYNTVAIGTQCWLKENLDVGTKVNGFGSDNGVIEKRCIGDIEDNCEKYGAIYRWGEVFNYKYPPSGKVQGICPNGWHVPSSDEFRTLFSSVNYDGNALKEMGQGSGKGTGTNTSGFSAMYVYGAGLYYAINGLWSSNYFSDVEGKPNIDYFFFSYDDNTVKITHLDFLGLAQYATFVRCIKD
ncbi:MAG: hypothetical protein M1495_12435 [Bacteroidetes bacterium]|nr:hypothetical protein [Bacteroidota bacterium]